MGDLLPCPFCGGAVTISMTLDSTFIVHVEQPAEGLCGMEFSDFNLDGPLVTAWNRRAERTARLARLDAPETREQVAQAVATVLGYDLVELRKPGLNADFTSTRRRMAEAFEGQASVAIATLRRVLEQEGRERAAPSETIVWVAQCETHCDAVGVFWSPEKAIAWSEANDHACVIFERLVNHPDDEAALVATKQKIGTIDCTQGEA